MYKCALLTRSVIFTIIALFSLALLVCPQADAANSSDFKLTPKPDAKLTSDRPVIKIRYPKDVIMDFSAVRLWVNDSEVSGNCLRTPTYVSYQSFVDMPEGLVRVHFEGKKLKDKNLVKLDWQFTLTGRVGITMVGHNAVNKVIYNSEKLIVQAQGVPDSKVWFSIEEIADEVDMKEGPTGVYEGAYTVKSTDNNLTAKVTVYLKRGSRTYKKEIPNLAAISGSLFAIRIDEPKQNDLVPLHFKIKGYTRPNAEVSMIPKIGMSASMDTNSEDRNSGALGAIPARADENGYFEIEYGFPIKLPNMQALLIFNAADAEGNRAIPTQLWVKFK